MQNVSRETFVCLFLHPPIALAFDLRPPRRGGHWPPARRIRVRSSRRGGSYPQGEPSGIRHECNLPQANPDVRPGAVDRPAGDCSPMANRTSKARPYICFEPSFAVGAALTRRVSRPAFGTNAICRRQIPTTNRVPWIALRAIVRPWRTGRARLVPTSVLNRHSP